MTATSEHRTALEGACRLLRAGRELDWEGLLAVRFLYLHNLDLIAQWGKLVQENAASGQDFLFPGERPTLKIPPSGWRPE